MDGPLPSLAHLNQTDLLHTPRDETGPTLAESGAFSELEIEGVWKNRVCAPTWLDRLELDSYPRALTIFEDPLSCLRSMIEGNLVEWWANYRINQHYKIPYDNDTTPAWREFNALVTSKAQSLFMDIVQTGNYDPDDVDEEYIQRDPHDRTETMRRFQLYLSTLADNPGDGASFLKTQNEYFGLGGRYAQVTMLYIVDVIWVQFLARVRARRAARLGDATIVFEKAGHVSIPDIIRFRQHEAIRSKYSRLASPFFIDNPTERRREREADQERIANMLHLLVPS